MNKKVVDNRMKRTASEWLTQLRKGGKKDVRSRKHCTDCAYPDVSGTEEGRRTAKNRIPPVKDKSLSLFIQTRRTFGHHRCLRQ